MHGDDLGENGLFFHYDVSEPVIRNALLFRLPKGERGGRRIKAQVRSLDVTPTILSYLGIPLPHDSQGESLLPLIMGDKGARGSAKVYIDRLPWWEYTLSRWYLEMQSASGREFSAAEQNALPAYRKELRDSFAALAYPPGDIAVRTDRWKLILRQQHTLLGKVSWWRFITGKPKDYAAVELYDLSSDPLERNNVADRYPAVVAELTGPLKEWDAAMEKARVKHAPADGRLIIPYP
jgi:arylsulfatase A-like enzyme